MKFIREIIAEKTSMAGTPNPGPCPDDLPEPGCRGALEHPEDLDPADPVMSGDQSPDQSDHPPFPPESSRATTDDSTGPMMPDTARGFDGADEPGFRSDPGDQAGPSPAFSRDKAANQQPAELFVDVWDGDLNGKEYALDEDDLFAGVNPEPDAPAETHGEASPHTPETNAQAVMRTIYPTAPDLPDTDLPRDQTVDETPDAPSQDQAPIRSSFQGIRRRRASFPSKEAPEPGTDPDAGQAAEPETTPEPLTVPEPAAGRARRQAGRVKTRLLGFGNDLSRDRDPFDGKGNADPAAETLFPVGWMVVVCGPGRGNSFTLFSGVSQIGRGDGQAVRLDFGDNSISRSNHAAIAYDPEQQQFFLGHGGKANLVRLDGKPVLSTEPLNSGALIRIGETTLRFVGLCGAGFDWDAPRDGEAGNARVN